MEQTNGSRETSQVLLHLEEQTRRSRGEYGTESNQSQPPQMNQTTNSNSTSTNHMTTESDTSFKSAPIGSVSSSDSSPIRKVPSGSVGGGVHESPSYELPSSSEYMDETLMMAPTDTFQTSTWLTNEEEEEVTQHAPPPPPVRSTKFSQQPIATRPPLFTSSMVDETQPSNELDNSTSILPGESPIKQHQQPQHPNRQQQPQQQSQRQLPSQRPHSQQQSSQPRRRYPDDEYDNGGYDDHDDPDERRQPADWRDSSRTRTDSYLQPQQQRIIDRLPLRPPQPIPNDYVDRHNFNIHPRLGAAPLTPAEEDYLVAEEFLQFQLQRQLMRQPLTQDFQLREAIRQDQLARYGGNGPSPQPRIPILPLSHSADSNSMPPRPLGPPQRSSSQQQPRRGQSSDHSFQSDYPRQSPSPSEPADDGRNERRDPRQQPQQQRPPPVRLDLPLSRSRTPSPPPPQSNKSQQSESSAQSQPQIQPPRRITPPSQPPSPPLPAQAKKMMGTVQSQSQPPPPIRRSTSSSSTTSSQSNRDVTPAPSAPTSPLAPSAEMQTLRATIERMVADATRATTREGTLVKDLAAANRSLELEKEKYETMHNKYRLSDDQVRQLTTDLTRAREQITTIELRAASSLELSTRYKKSSEELTHQLQVEKDRLVRSNKTIQQLAKRLAALTNSTPETVLETLDDGPGRPTTNPLPSTNQPPPQRHSLPPSSSNPPPPAQSAQHQRQSSDHFRSSPIEREFESQQQPPQRFNQNGHAPLTSRSSQPSSSSHQRMPSYSSRDQRCPDSPDYESYEAPRPNLRDSYDRSTEAPMRPARVFEPPSMQQDDDRQEKLPSRSSYDRRSDSYESERPISQSSSREQQRSFNDERDCQPTDRETPRRSGPNSRQAPGRNSFQPPPPLPHSFDEDEADLDAQIARELQQRKQLESELYQQQQPPTSPRRSSDRSQQQQRFESHMDRSFDHAHPPRSSPNGQQGYQQQQQHHGRHSSNTNGNSINSSLSPSFKSLPPPPYPDEQQPASGSGSGPRIFSKKNININTNDSIRLTESSSSNNSRDTPTTIGSDSAPFATDGRPNWSGSAEIDLNQQESELSLLLSQKELLSASLARASRGAAFDASILATLTGIDVGVGARSRHTMLVEGEIALSRLEKSIHGKKQSIKKLQQQIERPNAGR